MDHEEPKRQRGLKNMQVQVLQNGVRASTPAIPDSGAATTIMCLKVAQKLDLDMKQFETAPQGLMVANGGSLTQNGYCDLEIQFCGKRASVAATISEDLDSTFLIGREDLVKLGSLTKNTPTHRDI